MAARRFHRTASGAYLIELLVALAISGFLAVAMGASLSETMRTSSGAQNQLVAADVAQELIDRIRNTAFEVAPPYDAGTSLPVLNGTYPVHIDSDDGVVIGTNYSFQQQSLLMDVGGLTWSNGSLNNRFHGSATVSFNNGPTTSTRLVTVVVTWPEGSATRTYSLSTVIAKSGLHI